MEREISLYGFHIAIVSERFLSDNVILYGRTLDFIRSGALRKPRKFVCYCPCPARFSECPPPSLSIGGGRSAGHDDQPDVHDVPPLYEEKIRIPDSAPQHPLLSPGTNSPERQHYQRPHRLQPDRKIFTI